jgi:homoserine kinase
MTGHEFKMQLEKVKPSGWGMGSSTAATFVYGVKLQFDHSHREPITANYE